MTNSIIKCIKLQKTESGASYGQFLITLTKSGQGITIGNSLRRILLNDLGGLAISSVRISNVKHEFSIIPGVREDILNVLLNLKGIIFKNKKNIKTIQFGRLKEKGPCVITASSFKLPNHIEIINSKHYIMTISESNVVEIEIKIEYGTGYKLALETFSKQNSEFLQIDSIFMPVKKVNFKVENIYNNKFNVKERLFLEIWTNGSITPNFALLSAAKIIINLFFNIFILNESFILKEKRKPFKITQNYSIIPIEQLELSKQTYNKLKTFKINTVYDLLNFPYQNLVRFNIFDTTTIKEIKHTLKKKLNIIL
uniref:DNA-directed RNA polymerase subunit alpha n=1 Tax=Nitzschia sp. IriIs04 TaxID=1444690 RepID=A0A0S3QPP9_9STRA|nr:RNA polymerase alpha subunit [Nitzschia sp. IriIs04]BAT70291.1 RNA polymerase alpha subunit [Nitzschia sp. IriIs04]